MARLHLFEFEDLPGFPAVIRDLVTDYLRAIVTIGRFYQPIIGLLAQALRDSGSDRLLDLCSGGGGPIASVITELEKKFGLKIQCTLTDRYPSFSAFRRLENQAPGRIHILPEPVDAATVPARLDGFRTLFNAFHHFPPEKARQILQDAVENAPGVAVFELVERTPLKFFLILLSPLWAFLITPFIRPFSWKRLFFTYLIPAVPFVALWDGLVSVLRSYKVSELRSFASSVKSENFVWTTGRRRNFLGIPVIFLIGHRRERRPIKNESGTPARK